MDLVAISDIYFEILNAVYQIVLLDSESIKLKNWLVEKLILLHKNCGCKWSSASVIMTQYPSAYFRYQGYLSMWNSC